MIWIAKQYGAKGLAWVKVVDGELNGPVAKFLTPGIQEELTTRLSEDKDLVLFVADIIEVANATLGALSRDVLLKSLAWLIMISSTSSRLIYWY